MTISWHGDYTVKIITAGTTLVLDPHGKTGSAQPFRGKADIVALTNPSDPAMSYLDGITGEPTLITTPGEYSLSAISLRAISSRPGSSGETAPEKSLHRWLIENMTIVHLGAITRSLTGDELKHLEQVSIDILLLPIRESEAFTLKDALAIITTLEPRLVIPIAYQNVKEFAEQLGINPRQQQPKLALSRNKLPAEGMETIILSP